MRGAIITRLGIVVTVVALTVVLPGIAMAQGAISQGYTTDELIPIGALVSGGSDETSIEIATSDNAARLLGVVSEESLVELSNNVNQLQVVTNGLTVALVSDINGEVKLGDPITASPLKGIGMRATEKSRIVGTARAEINEATKTTEQTITDKAGNKKTVTIAVIPIQVNVTYFDKTEETKSILPEFILNLAKTVAGREVSIVRVLTALLVLLAGVGAIGVLLYSSVRSSIISIGRNPLAASAVNKSLLEVAFLSLGVLLIMLSAVYLILVV